MLLPLFSLLLFGTASLAFKLNSIFILADDQDVHLDSLSYMPLLQKHITKQGTNFSKHYCTVAQCCSSRVTLWTGKAAHNTDVTDVKGDFGMLADTFGGISS
jgi:arylsulfatase A-like enzyme